MMSFLMRFRWIYKNKKYPLLKIRAVIKKATANRIKKENSLIKNKFKANSQSNRTIQFLIN